MEIHKNSEKSEQDKKKVEKTDISLNRIKGIIFGVVVLLGNGIHPIINNSRPVALDPLNFLLQMSIIEFFMAIPSAYLELKYFKKQHKTLYKPKSPTERWKFYLNLSFIGIIFTGSNYLYIVGLKLAGSISGSLALKVSPIYLLLIGVVFLGEKFNWKQLIIVFWMLGGLYYLATEGTLQADIFSLGFGILLITPLLWGTGHAITKILFRKNMILPSFVILVRTGGISILIFLINLGTNGWNNIAQSFLTTENQWFSFLMGGTYFCMHFGWYWAIKYLDLGFTSALVTPSPALTILFAYFITADQIYPYQIIGMIIVFIGLYALILLNTKSRSSKIKPDE